LGLKSQFYAIATSSGRTLIEKAGHNCGV